MHCDLYSVIVSAATDHSAYYLTDTQAHTDPRLTIHIRHAANQEIDRTTNEPGL